MVLRAIIACLAAVSFTAVPASASTGANLSTNPLFGVDWAWGTPSLASLHANGVQFIAGYESYDPSKNLSASEVRTLHHAGIPTVLVWETTANRSLDGYSAGVADGQAAAAQARAVGEPVNRPIFFAVDFDTTGQTGAIRSYFQGVNRGLGSLRVGAYGGYSTVSSLFNAHLIRYGWQTYAWSYGQWDHRAKLQQYSNDHFVGGVGVDFDRSTAADFGQFPFVAMVSRKRHHTPKAHATPQFHRSPNPLLVERQLRLRELLQTRGCRRRKSLHHPLGHKCLTWFSEGDAVGVKLRLT